MYVYIWASEASSTLGCSIEISRNIYARAALAWTKKKPKKQHKVHLEMRILKQTELQRLKNRGKKGLGYDQKSLHGPLLFLSSSTAIWRWVCQGVEFTARLAIGDNC